MNYILLIFSVIGGLVIGGLVVFLVNRYLLATRSKTILEEAEKEAEVIKKNKLLEVKEKFIHMKAEMEKQANARNAKIQSAEAKLKQREMQLSQQQQDLQKKKSAVIIILFILLIAGCILEAYVNPICMSTVFRRYS